ncbi:hydrogenase expression/formation protein HypC [Rhodopseudomonas rhenobacensis]|uniref:Hydrogenase maturation factor HypC n=1 Tax=Rhodopseudomonas rhenobacensis TaxID=87461 RepID=A0A7W7Z1L3_9BRAD|nr:HypC/HybG/HupF family hydrogenase formation chaperone [Rhodopseudomonas rhenobacensis]MBB5046246.1 hydrogenase expression/formation protein HypC [Rhodopseudomonas rhenobacensis]
MCLGIPVQIKSITDPDKMLALAEVKGVRREINVTLVSEPAEPLEALIGRWVLLHVGFAVSRIDEDEARITLELLAETGAVEEELAAMVPQ